MSFINFRNHPIYFVNNKDFFRAVAEGQWEQNTFDVIDRFVKPDSIFVDVGSWCGVFSIYAKRLGAKVFAAEPDPTAYQDAVQNIKANRFSELITLQQVALSDVNGTAELNTMHSFGNSESSLIDRGTIRRTVPVQTQTLQSFIEGSEVLLLKGALDYLMMCRPVMYVSFHPAWIKDINGLLTDSILPLKDCYHLIGAKNKPYSLMEIRDALMGRDDHSFLLLPKE